MIELEKKYHKDIIDFIGEGPENTGPIFILRYGHSAVFVEEGKDYKDGFLILLSGRFNDLYIYGTVDPVALAIFLQKFNIRSITSFQELVIGKFGHCVKNLIYSFNTIPEDYNVYKPFPVKLTIVDEKKLLELPREADFMFNNFQDIKFFLNYGLCYSIIINNTVVSCGSIYSMSDNYTDICVYTAMGHRKKGYAFNCAGAIINELKAMKKNITWTTAESNISSMKIAEKLGMFIIGEFYCYY